jgi:hypothetical protein
MRPQLNSGTLARAKGTETMTDDNNPLRTIHSAPYITCAPCHRIIPVETENPIAEYLSGAGPVCPSCKKQVDLWAWALEHFDVWQDIGSVPLGPLTSHIQFQLPRHAQTEVRLADHQIPSDARILSRSYCGQENSDIFALEVHGGSPRGAPFHEGAIRLYGATFAPGSDASKTAPHLDSSKHMISITWVPAGIDVDGWSSIWKALESFDRHDHLGVVIPANTAVELTTDRVTTRFLSLIPDASRQNIKQVSSELTYHHRLNVLLPMIAWLTNAPAFPKELAAGLNILKSLRNQVGHTGRTRQEVTRTDAAKHLRACIFGFHYLHLLEQALNRKWPGPKPAS